MVNPTFSSIGQILNTLNKNDVFLRGRPPASVFYCLWFLESIALEVVGYLAVPSADVGETIRPQYDLSHKSRVWVGRKSEVWKDYDPQFDGPDVFVPMVNKFRESLDHFHIRLPGAVFRTTILLSDLSVRNLRVY